VIEKVLLAKAQFNQEGHIMDGQRKSILIVEDDDGNRKLLALLLEEAGYAAHHATDGLEALEEMKRVTFDAVITDRDMPRMNGLELLAQSRALWPEIPVILVSAHAIDARETVELRGAFAWVQKPYEAPDLLAIVQAAVTAFPHRSWVQSSTTTISA